MFKLVPLENFKIIRDRLKERLPRCAQLYNVIQLVISGALPPKITTKLYTFVGNDNKESEHETEESDNFFAVAVQYRETYDDYAVIISSPNVHTEEMLSAFESLIDWKKPICFCAVDICISSDIAEMCRKNGKLLEVDPCDLLAMTVEAANSVQVINTDPDVIVRELDPSDGELVTKRWKFASENTQSFMESMIKNTGSAGVYVKNKLVSWIVIFAVGSLNALYTEDEFRNKGYARLTMLKVCQTAGKMKLVPNVQVQKGNLPSSRLMESVGFKYSHEVEWVIYSDK